MKSEQAKYKREFGPWPNREVLGEFETGEAAEAVAINYLERCAYDYR